ncbi:MFS transporter [Fertoebacter nigrum]|uniref:MFS transporter n=1 Tax=Fertoeibacter niger TaxID=2656921 RepID=A0A8X8GTU3_9RHOB|nr:MFS transporter [Fertoeibacter niger]NUB44229.1 MFS transporter [Fertoeibacter niger]
MIGTAPGGQGLVAVLGIVQIFAWGSTYYLLAVLADPIVQDTGWSRLMVMGGFSLGLLAAGLAAMRIGRLIQQYGGRPVMAGAMLLLAIGLAVLGLSPGLAGYMLGWVLLGLGMGAGLYDAAFSTLGRIHGSHARKAITQLTLWGGFASTVCWPISALLVESLGWRGTCLAYAALHLLVTLPLCVYGIPRQASALSVNRPVAAKRAPQDARFWILALGLTAFSILSTIVSVHLLSLLQAQGLTIAAAVAVGAVIGPSQVGARVVEMLLGGRHHAVWTMLAATVLTGLGIAGLNTALPPALLLAVYGAGNGIWSIARGAVPLALFGPDTYAIIMGRLATPALLAGAVAPLLGAAMIDGLGAGQTMQVLAVLALVPVGAALMLLRGLSRSATT